MGSIERDSGTMTGTNISWKITLLTIVWCFLNNEDAVVAFSRNVPLVKQIAISSSTTPSHHLTHGIVQRKHHHLKMSAVENAGKATLTDETTWKVRIQFKKLVTKKGNTVSPTYLFDWKFIEDIDYE